MELSKALLGALLLGIAVETSSCTKDESKNVTPANNGEQMQNPSATPEHSDNCPACGLG